LIRADFSVFSLISLVFNNAVCLFLELDELADEKRSSPESESSNKELFACGLGDFSVVTIFDLFCSDNDLVNNDEDLFALDVGFFLVEKNKSSSLSESKRTLFEGSELQDKKYN